jgi:hypothetical protein
MAYGIADEYCHYCGESGGGGQLLRPCSCGNDPECSTCGGDGEYYESCPDCG